MRRKLFVLALLAIAYVACDDPNLVDNPSFDLWCGDKLCSWDTDAGRVERVASWHRGDYGVSFEETPTQISQLAEGVHVRCMRVDLIADVAASAEMTVGFDFNDDGIVEHTQAVPAVSWRSVQFLVHTPLFYDSVRYVLRKSGAGHAVIAQLRIVEEPTEDGDPCVAEPLQMADGARCTADVVCASGICLDGHCSSCAADGGCDVGAACFRDEQCASGSCQGGACASCGGDGVACPERTPCDADTLCESGACTNVFAPSRAAARPEACLHCTKDEDCGDHGGCDTELGQCSYCGVSHLPSQCAQCTNDADCVLGPCTFGVCSSCKSDADCAQGESCRSADRFDFGPLDCRPAPHDLPRGALCSADAQCAGDLHCGGAKGEPARCGIACETDLSVCDDASICALPGVVDDFGMFIGPFDNWSDPASHVATCYPARNDGDADLSCEVHAQCMTSSGGFFASWAGACCEGRCDFEATISPHGDCVFPAEGDDWE
jgi:hypothetical protein